MTSVLGPHMKVLSPVIHTTMLPEIYSAIVGQQC